MARFRGTVQGGRGKASRLGHRGITTDANGWDLGVNVDGGIGRDTHNPALTVDEFTVYATGGSSEERHSHKIAEVSEVIGADDRQTRRQITLYDAAGKVVAEYTV
jgi:hypothetical protein|tara:strand:- start:2498 stop:2812 length:315 start_codon:yes stop_codon:yes gene_type:complete